jgi:hypothetical protein
LNILEVKRPVSLAHTLGLRYPSCVERWLEKSRVGVRDAPRPLLSEIRLETFNYHVSVVG